MWRYLIIKDLKRFLRDRSALIVLIAMPIVITTILGFSLQSMFSLGTADAVPQVKFAIVDQDKADYTLTDMIKDLSANPMGAGMLNSGAIKDIAPIYDSLNPRKLFFETFLGNPEIQKIASYQIMTESQAQQAFKEDDIAGIVTLKSDFSRNMTLNLLTPFRNPVAIELVPNSGKVMSSAILESLMKGFIDTVNQNVTEKNVNIEQSIRYDLNLKATGLMQASGDGIKSSSDIKDTQIEGFKPIGSKSYYAIAMMAMFLLFTAAMGGSMVLEEKDLFTYDRHMMAGVKPFDILIGKACVIALLTWMQSVILMGYSNVVFGVTWGNMGTTALILAAVIVAISGLGILLATIGSVTKSYKVAKVFENGFIQVLALFGGSYLPIEQMPSFIKTLSHFVLNGLVLKAYLYNMMGYSFKDIAPIIGYIVLNGVLFTAIALIIFMRKEAKSHVAYYQEKTLDTAQ